MNPFVQAARRFSARCAMFWKLGKRPVLRAVAEPSLASDLVQVLRWEEAQPEHRRPLVVIEETFSSGPAYFEAVTNRILEAFATLQATAREAGVTLPEVTIAESAEPVVAAVQTAERVSGALPEGLEGLTIALVPARVQDMGDWAARVGGLVKAVAALSTTGPDGRGRRVHWLVYEWPGGPLAAVLGSGVELTLDEGGLFAWWRDGGNSRPSDATGVRSGTGHDQKEDPEDRAAVLRRSMAGAVEALRADDPERAIVLFRTAQGVCAKDCRTEEEAVVWMAIGGAQLLAKSPADAATSYRTATELAKGCEAWSLACQAALGAAGVELFQKRHRGAATVYLEAGELAEKARSVALRIEAMRMAGVCHPLGGDKQETEASLANNPPPIPTEPVIHATQRIPITMPRRALPFVRGPVDLDMLDAMIAADAETRATETPAEEGRGVDRTRELRIPAEGGPVLPFAGSRGAQTNTTQPIRVLSPDKATPFSDGGIDPSVFRRPPDDPDGKDQGAT